MRRARLVALSLWGCLGAPSNARAAEAPVRVGFCARTVTSAAAPFAIATKMGWYKSGGIAVELVPIAGSTDCVKLVATGELPYSLPSIESLPVVRIQGVKAKVFYTAYQGNIYGIAVPRESAVRSVKDLRGKSIGVASMASGGVQVARSVLAQNGMDPEKDARLVVVGEAAQAAALLRKGEVAALALYDTQFALVENAGLPLRQLDVGAVAHYPSNGFVALEQTLQDKRAQSIALGRGYAMGTVFAMANPEAAVKIVWEVFPFTKPTGKSEADALRDDVKTLLARAQNWRLEAGGVRRWGESNVKEFDAYEDFLVKWNVLKQRVPATDLVTNELIDEINRFDAAKVAAEAKAFK
jgi:NitT/TauT family transport system substrate-binding protein